MPLLRPLLIATALLASGSIVAQQAPLGRLFFTPEQRATLDRQRQYQQTEVQGTTGSITVNGLVRRSSGKVTTWVNGEARDNDNQPPSESGKNSILVGERLNQASGELQDLLQGGEIKISPARPR